MSVTQTAEGKQSEESCPGVHNIRFTLPSPRKDEVESYRLKTTINRDM